MAMKRINHFISALLIYLSFVLYVNEGQAQTRKIYNIIMRNTGSDTLWDGTVIRTFGFTRRLLENPLIPSQPIYANEGDTLILKVENISQGEPHTIHPHGMDANQQNDGTPMTSFSIKHQEKATYTIPCTHAGTFIYHCHFADVAHVQMGMYGLLIVRPKNGSNTAWTGGPSFDQEHDWLCSEVDTIWHDSAHTVHMLDTASHGELFSIPPYHPTFFLINGQSHQELKALTINGKKYERIYLRLANIGFYLNKYIIPSGLNAEWIDSDGRPLPKAMSRDTMIIAPGERYGVMLNADKEFTDSIAIQYLNMNTSLAEDTQYVDVKIKGDVSVPTINTQENNLLTLYPNPASTEVYISLDNKLSKGQTEISVFDMLGKKVDAFYMHGNAYPYNCESLAKGIYIIRASVNNEVYYQKLMVR